MFNTISHANWARINLANRLSAVSNSLTAAKIIFNSQTLIPQSNYQLIWWLCTMHYVPLILLRWTLFSMIEFSVFKFNVDQNKVTAGLQAAISNVMHGTEVLFSAFPCHFDLYRITLSFIMLYLTHIITYWNYDLFVSQATELRKWELWRVICSQWFTLP